MIPKGVTAFVLFFALVFVSVSVVASEADTPRVGEKTTSSSQPIGSRSEKQLRFEGVEFKTDPLFIHGLYNKLKYQKLRQNMAGGLTSEGVNFSVSW